MSCQYREKGQPGLKPGYGKAVESRLCALEDNMENVAKSVQDVLGHLRAQSSTQSLKEAGNQLQSQHQQQTERQPTPPLESPLLVEPTMQVLTEPEQVWQLPAQSLPNPVSLVDDFAPPSQLPDPTILADLIEFFFEKIYPWAPLFNKAHLTSNMFLPERQILLHGIVVLGFRFWTKPDPPLDVRDSFVKTSRERILLQTIDVCSLVGSQALALLTIDALGQGPGPRTWNLMAMLVTAAQQQGLARSHIHADSKSALVNNEDAEAGAHLSTIEAEEKRRLFWTIYSLDRFSSVPHGEAGAIDSRTIKLPYPASDADWNQSAAPEWFQGASATTTSHHHHPANLWHHYIDLLTLVDRSNQLLVQPVNLTLPANCQEWQSSFRILDMTLSTWFGILPRHIREPQATFDPMRTLIHATFYLINIRMYTVAMLPSTNSPYLRPSASARGHCRKAVQNVTSLTASLQAHEISPLGPMFAFSIWVAARSLIILWTTGYETTSGEMPADLESLLSSLHHSAVHWPCAQSYVDIIQLILDTRNDPGGPTGLDIFNDTRRTSYGLQNSLGTLAGFRAMQVFTELDDFLDVPFLEAEHRADLDSEWL